MYLANNSENTPRRNPFNTHWRTNLPSFQECLASLGSRENFLGLGEALTAASPPPRERPESTNPLNSPKTTNIDFSFLTLEISEVTVPGTPPPPVEKNHQSCAPTPEKTPRVCRDDREIETDSVTPTHLPPLCPNISPIAHSPSAAFGLSSLPRTEPVIMMRASPSTEWAEQTLPNKGENLENIFMMECPTHLEDCHPSFPPENISIYEDLLTEEDAGLGEWFSISQRAERIVPALSEWTDGNWITQSNYHCGDFAYHRPLVYRFSEDREENLRGLFFY